MTTLHDVFSGDGFTCYALTAAIQKVPPAPTTIGDMGIFRDLPIDKTLVAVEEEQGILALVPTTKRGGPGIPSQDSKRKVRSFKVPHIQLDDAVLADDVTNVRAFGQAEALAGVNEVVARKLAIMRRNIDTTNEYLRLGALFGVVTYPANSVDANLNLFDEFGTTVQTLSFELDQAGTEVIEAIIPEARDKVEAALGGTPYSGLHCLCDRTFFRALIAHAKVKALYLQQQALWQLMPITMERPNRMKLSIGGVTFEEYYGLVSGIAMPAAGTGVLFPLGADCFLSHWAPADYVETVGTLGQSVYARQYVAEDGKSVQLQAQSNPLHICTRPRALLNVTLT